MSRVFWDTNLFVYLMEGEGLRAESVVALRRRMIERGDELLTSSLTLGELLVKPVDDLNGRLQRLETDVRSMDDRLEKPPCPRAAGGTARGPQARNGGDYSNSSGRQSSVQVSGISAGT